MQISAEARRQAIEKALHAFEELGATEKEAIPLPYKDGNNGPFPVINVPVDVVLFNPRSHRIKAQLESHPKGHLVTDNPYSEEAQAVVQEILEATKGFEDLMANLSELGQSAPGVVTRDGLLVNANRRLAALRKLGQNYIRAAVLPSDADEHAIDRLELELQVQRHFKQPYTYTNELIFINELLSNYDYGEEKTAKALNWAASGDQKELKRGVQSVKQAVRIYALIRYIQLLSENAVPLIFFDDKRQVLIELDERYESLKGSDPEGAERMRHARIAGILSDNYYNELRKIDGESTIEVLLPFIEEKEILGEEIEAFTATTRNHDSGDNDSDLLDGGDNDGDLLSGGEETYDEDPDLLPLVSLIAKSYGKDEIELPSGKKIDPKEVVKEYAQAVGEAAEEVAARNRASKNLNDPIKQLDEAIKKAKAAAVGYKQHHDAKGFKDGKFKYLARKLDTQVEAIKKAIEQKNG